MNVGIFFFHFPRQSFVVRKHDLRKPWQHLVGHDSLQISPARSDFNINFDPLVDGDAYPWCENLQLDDLLELPSQITPLEFIQQLVLFSALLEQLRLQVTELLLRLRSSRTLTRATTTQSFIQLSLQIRDFCDISLLILHALDLLRVLQLFQLLLELPCRLLQSVFLPQLTTRPCSCSALPPTSSPLTATFTPSASALIISFTNHSTAPSRAPARPLNVQPCS